MAKNKPNDQVQVIDSGGRQFRSRRVWAEKKRSEGLCYLDPQGQYVFYSHAQQNGGSSAEFPQGTGALINFPSVQLRPAAEVFVGGAGNFLPYPQAERGAGRRSLRAMYPVLAKMGAGL